VLAALAFAPADVPALAERVVRGLRAAVEGAGAALVGGDVSRSPGPMVLDLVVLGRAEAPVLRSGVRPGDELWVTGELGAAAAAVQAWQAGHTPPPAAAQAFRRPTARIEEARWLAEHLELHGLIDLSDGLAGDARHLAAASGVGITLSGSAVPVHAAAAAAGADDHGLTLALAGGEDYELCLAAAPGRAAAVRDAFVDRFGVRLTRVGVARAGQGAGVGAGVGVTIVDAHGRVLELSAYNHFGASGGTG